MNIKIVADSCCDLSKELKEKLRIELVPLTLELGKKKYLDDEKLNLKEYIKEMRECDVSPKSACPSPEQFKKSYECDEKNVFVVTLSDKLSGSYNSAVLAKDIFMEEVGGKFIHVFNSYSASIGETLIALKINELSKENINPKNLMEKTTKYINDMKTFFILDNVEHLAKAGRLNNIAAKIANVLNIKLILGSTDEGSIRLVHKVRGYKKAFKKFVKTIEDEGHQLENKILGIAHCNCLERALAFKEEVVKQYNFKDIIIVETGGLSTTYADEGGLVIAF